MCGSMVDIQSTAAGLGEEKRKERKKKDRNHRAKILWSALLHRVTITRMWADAHRDGRPAEYRWRLYESSVIPLLAARRKFWPTPTARVPCSNAANMGERKTWMQSEFCTWQNSVRRQEPSKIYIQCISPRDGQTLCKVWLACGERRRRSSEVKTRNPLKFAGVPETPEPISAASGLKFPILWGHMEEILLFNKFSPLSIHALVAKIQPDKVVGWCTDGDFLRNFWVLYFQRAACGTFQTCILNSH